MAPAVYLNVSRVARFTAAEALIFSISAQKIKCNASINKMYVQALF